MNKTNINTSWLRRGAWGIVVLLVGLLLGSCGTAGPTGETPGDGNGPEEPVLKTLPAKCLTVEANGEITAFDDEKEDCKLKEFAIPSEKDGIKITVIGGTNVGNNVFRGKSLTRLTIPNSVTTIGYGAFADNQLTKLSIPNSVTSIGNYAFLKNELTSITIPDSVTTIGASAFSNNQLTSLTIGSKVETIGNYAFQNNKLESLTIGSKVETIGTQAFYVNKLTSITIPKSVTVIGVSAFLGNPLVTVILELRTEALTFVTDSFPNNLWTAYDGANKDKAGTWTWGGSAWTFTAAATP